MTNRKKQKGPEHIKDVLKKAKKEWQEANTNNVMATENFKEIKKQCPGYIEIYFMYIDGDPQYIRTFNLN